MYGWQDFSVSGTLIATSEDESVVEFLRQIATEANADTCAATHVNGVMVCRYLGHSAAEAKDYFIRCWQRLRLSMAGKEAVIPRIWNT
jgi:urease accessory protein